MKWAALLGCLVLPVVTRGDASTPWKQPVESLLADWLAAQNTRDFARYRGLYDPGFLGIRRSGDRVRTFDYRGWMNDRERMFQRPMQVAARGVSTEKDGARTRIRFEQEFRQGTYTDVGPKELVVETTSSGVHIVREEMLRSKRVGIELDDLQWAVVHAMYPAADRGTRTVAGKPIEAVRAAGLDSVHVAGIVRIADKQELGYLTGQGDLEVLGRVRVDGDFPDSGPEPIACGDGFGGVLLKWDETPEDGSCGKGWSSSVERTELYALDGRLKKVSSFTDETYGYCGCPEPDVRHSIDCEQDKAGRMRWRIKRHEKPYEEKWPDSGEGEGDC
jgi:hypothetical protein